MDTGMFWRKDVLNAHDLIEDQLLRVSLSSDRCGIGDSVLKLSSEATREKLRQIKSDDLANVRFDHVRRWIGPSPQKRLSDELLKFDREVLGL